MNGLVNPEPDEAGEIGWPANAKKPGDPSIPTPGSGGATAHVPEGYEPNAVEVENAAIGASNAEIGEANKDVPRHTDDAQLDADNAAMDETNAKIDAENVEIDAENAEEKQSKK